MAKDPRIALIGSPTQRGTLIDTAKDQLFTNCLFQVVKNPVTGASIIRCSKRPAVEQAATVQATAVGRDVIQWTGATNGLYRDVHIHYIFSGTFTFYLYYGATSAVLIDSWVGGSTYSGAYITEHKISGIAALLIAIGDTAWYTTEPAIATAVTFTGDTHSGTKVIDNISSTTGLLPGQVLSNANIAAGTRIVTVDSVSQVTTDTNSTGSATTTITRSKIAKITDADFPCNAGKIVTGRFVVLDGYAFIMTTDGNIYQPDVNSVVNWTANASIAAQASPDSGIGLALYNRLIVGLSRLSIEFFSNTGNATGSVLSTYGQPLTVGCVSPETIKEADGTVYWVGGSRESDIKVYKLSGMGKAELSNQVTEATAVQFTGNIPLFFYALERQEIAGRELLFFTCYGVNGLSAVVSMCQVLDMATGIWSQWRNTTTNANLWVRGARSGAVPSTTLWAGSVSGALGKTNSQVPVFTDAGAGAPIARSIRTQRIDFGTNKKKFNNGGIRIIGDQQSSTYNVSVDASDDDYASAAFPTRTIDMSSNDPKTTRLGSFRRRSYTLSESNNSDCSFEALEFPDLTIGQS